MPSAMVSTDGERYGTCSSASSGPSAIVRAVGVGHLDAERRAAGHAVDAHRLGAQRQREVVLQVDDLAHLDARRRLQLEHGDDRPGADALDRALDAELAAALRDLLAEADELGLVERVRAPPAG